MKTNYSLLKTRIRVGDTWAIIDDRDFESLSQHTWYKNNKGYAYTFILQSDGKRKGVLMHRMLMQPEKGLDVHHINHDPLDNRRENLMICTHKENLQTLQKPNRKNQAPDASKYKGVHHHKNGKFKVTIRSKGKQYHLGYFADEIEAAKAYDAKAREYHGSFAVLNFP